jgi:hypothetical protein
MMANDDFISLISGVTGLGLILLCTVPALFLSSSSILRSKQYGLLTIYEDKDGVATEQSAAEFSAKSPKIAIITLSLLGLSVSLSIAVLGTLGLTEDGLFIANWINCGAWVSNRPARDQCC